MSYRAANGQRVTLPMIAASLAAAWDQAFDLAERLADGACGFGVARGRA